MKFTPCNRFHAASAIVLSVILPTLAEPAFAVSRSWVGTTGDWATAANWNPAAVPASADVLTFNDTGTTTDVTKSTTGAAIISSLVFAGSKSYNLGVVPGTGTNYLIGSGIYASAASALAASSSVLQTIPYLRLSAASGNVTLTNNGTGLFKIPSVLRDKTGATGDVVFTGSGNFEVGLVRRNGADVANGLQKSGAGTLTITGFATSFTGTGVKGLYGNVAINGGTLRITSGDPRSLGEPQAANAAWLTLNGGTLQVSTADLAITNANAGITLGSNGGTFHVDATRTLTLGGGGAANGLSGSGLLTKSGDGTLVLAGANTHTGSTTVSAGTLNVGPGGWSVTSGQTLKGTGTVVGPVTVIDNGTVEAGVGGTGKLSTDSLTFNTGAKLAVGTLANYATTVGVQAAGLTISPAAAIEIRVGDLTGALANTPYKLLNYTGESIGSTGLAAFHPVLPGRIAASVTEVDSTLLLTLASVTPDALRWTGAGLLENGWDTATANWKLTSSNEATSYRNTTDAVVFDDGADPASTTVTLSTGDVSPFSLTFNNSTNNYTLQGTYGIIGPVALVKNGDGLVTLETVNSYTGATTNLGGILRISGLGKLGGAAGNYAAPIINHGAFSYSSNAAQTLSGVISGPGELVKEVFTSTLTLSNLNTYTGKTTVSLGTLSVNSLKNLGEPSAVGAPTTVADGTIGLGGTLTYTGPATSSDRVLKLNAGSTLTNSGSGLLTLSGGTTGVGGLLVRGTSNTALSGVLAHGGNLAHTDDSTLTLSNPANRFGEVVVSKGILSVNSIADKLTPCALGAGSSITLGQDGFNNTGTLQFTGPTGGATDRDLIILSNAASGNGGIIENTVAGKTLTLSGTVTFSGTGTKPKLVLQGAGNIQVNSAITAPDGTTLTLSANGTGDVTLGGNIAGTGITVSKLAATGASSLTLAGNNTYSGYTTVGAGTLALGSDTALGTSAVTLSDSAIRSSDGAARSIANAVSMNGNIQFGSPTTGNLLFSGALSLNSTSKTLTVQNATEISGVLSSNNAAVWTKAGPGTLTLSGDNSYAGTTAVSEGTLLVTNPTGSGTGDTSVTIAAGATLGGTGTLKGSGTVNPDGTIRGTVTTQAATAKIAPGTAIGTLTVGAANLSAGGELVIQLDDTTAPKCDLFAVTGALDVTGAKLTVSASGTPAQAVYVISSYGTLTGAFGAVALPAGYQLVTNHDSNGDALADSIALVKLPADPYLAWLSGSYPTIPADQRAPDLDYDRDGLDNGIEFVIGADPTAFTSPATAGYPSGSVTGGNLVFSFLRSDASEAFEVVVESGSDLLNWPTQLLVPVAPATAPSVTVTDNGPTAADGVSVVIPMAGSRKFARLRVVIPYTP